jgi:hypothetical protein
MATRISRVSLWRRHNTAAANRWHIRIPLVVGDIVSPCQLTLFPSARFHNPLLLLRCPATAAGTAPLPRSSRCSNLRHRFRDVITSEEELRATGATIFRQAAVAPFLAVAGLARSLLAAAAQEQVQPAIPARLLVGFAPGSDLTARVLAEALTARLGRSVAA